ncbi:hypothetical protein EON76_05650 [bacterium]|nr:MAG: hypothetical protein EON76_05650 [bacterium]
MNHNIFPSSKTETHGDFNSSELLRVEASRDLGIEAVEDLIALSANSSEIAENWEYTPSGNLGPTRVGEVNHSGQADIRTRQSGLESDSTIALTMATEVNRLRGDAESATSNDRAQLEKIEALIDKRGASQNLEVAKAAVMAAINSKQNPELLQRRNEVSEAVNTVMTDREKESLQRNIDAIVAADKLPWTMPYSEVPSWMMDSLKLVHEAIVTQESEAAPDDIFRVPPPMNLHDGSIGYDPADKALLQKSGRNIESGGLDFSREELQQSGVFFVNRVGGGEQAIFGAPIPDPESDDGIFNVQDRSFLTREEFEKVYNYQQEQGCGVGSLDPTDIQTDMIVFLARSQSRRDGTDTVRGGFNGRETKYGDVRSPFVDSGFKISRSIEGSAAVQGDSSKRMNTITIHLVNGHPDYPGVSEMFDENTVEHDQKYMSAGDFVRDFYEPPTTEEEALSSIRYKSRTRRERVWNSPLIETSL